MCATAPRIWQLWHEQLKAIDGETRVVMEHTGRYYEGIARVLHEAGLFVSAVNPLLIKEYGNNSLPQGQDRQGGRHEDRQICS